jgi:kumamolisin
LGLFPRQLAAAYGVDSLWREGFKGQGRRVALLEGDVTVSQAPGSPYELASQCFGPWPNVQIQVLGHPPPTSTTEATLDALNVASIAPRASIYMFESVGGVIGPAEIVQNLPRLIYAALDPANTGGKRVDTISISFGKCEASFAGHPVGPVETALRRAAQLGVAVFAADGDEGSALSYTSGNGETTCLPPGNPVDTQQYRESRCGKAGAPGLSPGIPYPASSPFVTGVGGTELYINGNLPEAGSPGRGRITDEAVWNEQAPSGFSGQCGWPFLYFAGGGGASRLFTTTEAPWQTLIGLSGAERKPDISALAGSPQYLYGTIGTSGAAPLMAGATAVLDGYLVAHRLPTTGPLNPLLYQIAAQPKLYRQVFHDITVGNNDLLGVGCCDAGEGYDEASGLGSLNFARLAHVLRRLAISRSPMSRPLPMGG